MAAKKVSSKGLRVVLFGTPGSGKSSLLGALWQAAQTQEDALGGSINDDSGGLAELHDVVYAKEPEEESDDLAMYPISVEANGSGESIDATLIDCDGELAKECLAKSQAKLDYKSEGCQALLGADAILLLVDPTAGKAQIDKEFLQFGNFLHLLEKYRSTRVDVVGLPVYLVLTKCDAFAKPTDAGSAWLQKIEEGKRQVDKRFQDFLAKYRYRSELSFGKIDLHVWATSVKRPALADKSGKSQEPYGVAELFRRCFQSAREFHQRRQTAHHRLQMALFGFSSLIALMVCASAFFFAISPDIKLINLEREIGEALPADHKDWLNKEVDERLAKLAEVKKNPVFTKLPAETQKKVNDAEVEIKEYQRLNDIMTKQVPPDLKSARSEYDLVDIEDKLAGVEIPTRYQESWRETRLAKKKKQLQQDIASVRKEVGELENWLKEQVKKSKDLEKAAIVLREERGTPAERKKWLKNFEELSKVPYKGKRTDEVIPNSTSITYGFVVRFQNEEISKLRLTLLKSKEQLLLDKKRIEEIDGE